MWSISSSHHSSHVGTYLGEVAAYISRHRYLFIVVAVILTLVIVASVFILQTSAASQKVHSEAISHGQQSSLSTATSNTNQQQVAPVVQPEPPTNPTHTEASVFHSDSETTVKVNGEAIPIPENGSVHRTIQNNGNTTNVDVSVNSNSSGSNMSFNSTTVTTNNSSGSSQSSISINNSQ